MATTLAPVASGTGIAQERDPAVTDFPVNGNGTTSISLPLQWAGSAASYYRFAVVGNGYTWTISNVEAGQGSARNGKTIPLAGQSLTLTLTTTGLPVTGPTPTSAQYIDFAACTGPVNEFCNWTAARRYRFIVDPGLTASPATAVTTNGSSVREVTLNWGTVLSGQTITASCVTDAGAAVLPTIGVSPSSAVTNQDGKASFTITTSGLRLIAASGPAPSGRCTFRAHAGSVNTAVVEVQGQRIAPTLNVSPSSVNVPNSGSTEVDRVVVVGTRSPAEGGVTIDASCTAQAPATVSLDGSAAGSTQSGSKVTNASGEVTFRVLSQNLVTLPPTNAPLVRCLFKLRQLTATYEYVAQGRQITPSVSLSVNPVTQTGTTAFTATLSPAYPGFDIVPVCDPAQNIPQVTVQETSATTNASGQQTFNVTVPQLVITDPNPSVQPSALCRLRAGGVGGTGTLTFRTGNVCAMTLSPFPPGCGEPVN